MRRLMEQLIVYRCEDKSSIIVTNSYPDRPVPEIWRQRGVMEVSVGDDVYWTGAVARLYREARAIGSDYIALLNHDCIPEAGCMENLKNYVIRGRGVVAHAVLVLANHPQCVWWAGSRLRWGRSHKFMYSGCDRSALPCHPYLTDAMMGQCMLMPTDAAREEFLHIKHLPHYFADSVQTSEMRREGFKLFMVPNAIARTDQSDAESKRTRIRPTTLDALKRSWTAPYSSRNLRAAIVAGWYHQDRLSGRIFLSSVVAAGKIGKPILEYAKVMKYL